ncbi:Mitochondrial thiamine pyrophosphate carrier [Hondaea fermentalgiana]|uniref:Mitochondrial thiamine pyrophosphate carrier n=1 Tax=Hondaea fermentalgiana TaxID=2315210 RepID=A0A2R5G675_9STRA|nr:Mitochondrial thiamine pyrophosphate carrier [Hondaea fermentalgiana]|eukprot:GBG26035.1 Mitochondrial thiamine pyrophosphate carrier [Hondaea fermentalgiana]
MCVAVAGGTKSASAQGKNPATASSREPSGGAEAGARRRGRESAAGVASGVVSRLIVSPLDVLKIRLQLQVSGQDGYRGVAQSATKILREEGVRGLWKGTAPSLVLWGLYAGVQFPAYQETLRILGFSRETAPLGVDLVAGAAGSLAATTISYPLDTIRTQLVYRRAEHGNVFALTRLTLQRDGFLGFYRGFLPTVTQVVPGMAFSFAFYGYIKRHVTALTHTESKEAGAPSMAQTAAQLLSGSLAGVLSKVIVHPLDTVKKRIQVNHLLGRESARAARYNGMIDCFREMYIHEGPRSFFSGLVPTLLKSAVATAVTFATYEYALALLVGLTPGTEDSAEED